MRISKQTFAYFALCLVMLFGLIGILPPKVHADSLNITITTEASCNSKANGAASASMPVTSGSSVNITVLNLGGVDQTIGGPGIAGGTSVQKNAKESTRDPVTVSVGVVTAQTIVTFTPIPEDYNSQVYDNNCPIGSSPVSSRLIINPVVAPAPAPVATKPKATAPVTTPAPSPAVTTPAPTTATDQPVVVDTPKLATLNSTATPSRNNRVWIGIAIVAFAVALGIVFLKKNKIINPAQLSKYLKKRKKTGKRK